MDELDPRDLATWEVDDLPADFEDQVMARLEQEGLDSDTTGGLREPEPESESEPEPVVGATVHSLPPRRRGLSTVVTAMAVAAAVALTWGLFVRSPSEVHTGTVAVSDSPAMVELVPGVDAVVSPGGALTWTADAEVRVRQTQGRVRYEVTPGTAVAVQTPAGTVDVTGTIFSVEVLSMSDVSKRKSRSILTAAAAAATVAAIVVVHEGSVDARNDHGTVSVAAGERAVMTDASGPRAPTPSEEPTEVAEAPAPQPKASRYVSPEQRRRYAATRDKIVEAIERRQAATPEPEPEPEAESESEELRAVIPPQLDKEYIREVVKADLIPLARDCYNSVLEVEPEFGGRLVLDFDIMGDEDVGGIVDDVQPGEGTDVIHPEFVECMSESMMTLTFEPPEGGGTVHVTYPFIFEPG